MKNLMLTKVLLAACLLIPGKASELAVIAHPEMPVSAISADDLRAIYLATKTSLGDGRRVHPVLRKASVEMAAFSSEYLGKTESALRTYYRSLVFTGRWAMPVAFDSDAAVAAYVASTPGAIGFVRDASTARGVKALKVTVR